MKIFCVQLVALGLILCVRAVAADADLPGPPFNSDRYAPLWENSPFAVATPVAVESEQYFLVGVAQFDGVSYASIVDRQTQAHFVVTNTTPNHGMKLVSLTHGQDAASTSATIDKDGSLLRLKLDTGSAGGMPSGPAIATPVSTPMFAHPVQPVLFQNRFRRFPPHPRILVPPIYVPRPTANPE